MIKSTNKTKKFLVRKCICLLILLFFIPLQACSSTDANSLDKETDSSQYEKTIDEAKKEATAKLSVAQKLYESSEGKVADESTRKVLKEKIDSLDKILKQKLTSTSHAQKIVKETSALAEAITKVESSQKQKLVDEAKQAAQGVVEQGNSTFDSSAGRMENEQYRNTLRQKVDNLQSVMNSESATPEQINAAVTEVNQAVNDVNSNIEYKKQQDAQAAAQQQQQQQAANTYYPNCAAVRAAGAAPLYQGQPGYSSKLDRDKDGVACE